MRAPTEIADDCRLRLEAAMRDVEAMRQGLDVESACGRALDNLASVTNSVLLVRMHARRPKETRK